MHKILIMSDEPLDTITIVKMNGEREPFDPEKLRTSLSKAGASAKAVTSVVTEVENNLKDGMTTREIYRRAHTKLQQIEKPIAARYSLRKALQGFGPSGFPFEEFVGEVFRARGYEVKVGEEIKGECVSHEVDMVATNEDEYIVMEVKFHNSQRVKSDLKVALYVKARFDDLLSAGHLESELEGKRQSGWLLTNTKFTKNALHYAECVGLTIVSWDYPKEDNLQDMVEKTGLHPVTSLSSLTDRQKTLLLDADNVLCKDIVKDPDILAKLGLDNETVEEVVSEAGEICAPIFPDAASQEEGSGRES